MAEVFGVSASLQSVVALASAVIQIITKKDRYGQLEAEIEELRHNVATLVKLSQRVEKNVWSVLKSILQEHDDVFQGAHESLKKAQQILSSKRIRKEKLRFVIRKTLGVSPLDQEIDELAKEIGRHNARLRSYLDVALSSSFSRHFRTPDSKIRTPREAIAIGWLSSSDQEATHLNLRDKRLTSGGEWLFDSQLYKQWRDFSDLNNILWLSGLPGAGKTHLASIVIDDLIKTHQSENAPVIYFYCDYARQETHTAAHIYSSLLKQLLSNIYPLPDTFMTFFSSYQRGADTFARPRLDDLLEQFSRVARLFEGVFVLIDALDECPTMHRKSLLCALPVSGSSIRVLITSRHERNIARALSHFPHIHIPKSLEPELKNYIEVFIRRSNLDGLLKGRQREEVVDEIYSKSRGLFLLARLHLQAISYLGTFGQIKEVLAESTQSLDETYSSIFRRVTMQLSALRSKQATTVLSWIFRAKRPLLVAELLQAIAVSVDEHKASLHEHRREQLTEILDACFGLVVIDEERSVIRFVHFTVQEYLQVRPSILHGECEIARTCLTFLTFESFARNLCRNDKDLKEKVSRFPLLEYAARYWGVHGKDCAELTFSQLATKFLCNDDYLASANQVMDYTNPHPENHIKVFTRKLSGLHAVASFGLDQLLESVMEHSHAKINEVDDQGQTPLIHAAKHGQTKMVELLMQRGGTTDVEDETRRSALSWAALNGHTAVVDWLLSQDTTTNINAFDHQHSTPLHLAFERHHYDIVDLLVKRGASLNIVDQWQRTAVQLAFSGPSPVNLQEYEKDKSVGRLIAQGGQARVSVFRRRKELETIHEPYPFLFRKAFDTAGDEGMETQRLLVQERDYLRNLHHPNIVKFIAYEESSDHFKAYLYTEYCDGGDLSKFVRKDFGNGRILEPQRRLSKTEIWHVFIDLAAAVSYLHYGVIKEEDRFSLKTDWRPFLHRDIKPANVVVQESKTNYVTYKLCDLGIAKIWDPSANQTRKGRGTTAYMPKEVKEQLKPWTVKGDIYSLGATICELEKDFEDIGLTALLARCMDDVPSKRPNSLILLQRAREELAALENRGIPPFLPYKPVEMDYIHQAIIELLERLFHSFYDIGTELRNHLTEKLTSLLEDSKLRSSDSWGLANSTTLLLILGRVREVENALKSGQASWDCSWETYGLTPKDIAKHDGLSILD